MFSWLGSFIAVQAPWLTQVVATAAEGAAHSEQSSSTTLPSLAKFLYHWLGPEYEWIEHWVNVLYALLTSIILCTVAITVYRKRNLKNPGPFQNFIEMLVEGMYNFLYGILGHETKKYVPFLGTLFFYILMNNLWGVVPLGHAPTTSINITASLAIMVFLYAQYTGIRRLGIVGYLDHLAGNPRGAIMWALVPLMLPMHLIGEVAKPFSLALRLFGNITGEDILVGASVMLGIMTLSFVHSPIGIPYNVITIPLGLMFSTIQALVFTLLSTIYILMMLPHEEHH
jgi:F-type H+-transporting ATPase subunit a